MLITILLSLLCPILIWLEAPWYIMGIFGLPAVIVTPGWGWSRWLHRNDTSSNLQIWLDSMWLSLGACWFIVAFVREAGIEENQEWWLWGVSSILGLGGLAIAYSERYTRPLPKREKYGLIAILLALVFFGAWKSSDLARPLDGYWYLEDAADPRNSLVPVKPARNWSFTEEIGWAEAGAMRMVPSGKNPDLVATSKVKGRITLAVRGPVGSYIAAGEEKNTVQSFMIEDPSEGAVARYLDRGTAAISVWVDLQPGEHYGLDLQGDEVYLIPSAEAVWALHATGELRYTHYYQLLNQVENQNWANEVLKDRRFTWNQPPGWSPLLAVSTVMVSPDLQGASMIFLWVLLLIGGSSLRLASIIAPYGELPSFVIPAFLMVVHGLLMVEPGSFNFPDSLYTAAILATLIALFEKKPLHFGLMGIATQALRWPGAILCSIFWILFYRLRKEPNSNQSDYQFNPILSIRWLWIFVAGGIVIAGIASLTNDADRLLEILYFETFPEHWHGNYNPIDLLSRMPAFYGKWFLYTGGSIVLALPFVIGPRSSQRSALQIILGGAFVYSLLLATIDHHPSHYFLPLVALTGPALVCAFSCLHKGATFLVSLSLLGISIYLWNGIV
ncbi:MAG: hypothetical protein VX278_10030 [Myxococcota bacterium]|nr:hypothetical protein [Myxococcota bacterium]